LKSGNDTVTYVEKGLLDKKGLEPLYCRLCGRPTYRVMAKAGLFQFKNYF